MMNIPCVTVFRIDVNGLLQHVVHENNERIVAMFTSKCCETVHPPASSLQSVRQLMTQIRQKIVFILVPTPTRRTKLKIW